MKKKVYFYSLLMAIVMMAMSPMKSWAEMTYVGVITTGDNAVNIETNDLYFWANQETPDAYTLYRFVAPQSGHVIISSSLSPGVDYDKHKYACVFDSDGNVVSTRENPYYQIEFGSKEGQTYYVGIRLNDGTSESDYPITLTYNTNKITLNNQDLNGVININLATTHSYVLYQFTAPQTGAAYIYTDGDSYTKGRLYDSDWNFVEYGYDLNFGMNVKVENGETYYLSVQSQDDALANYPLYINIQPIPSYSGTLALSTGEGASIEEHELETTLKECFGDDLSYFMDIENGVTYKRKPTTNKWGTVILPYELRSNSKVAYYILSTVDMANNSLEFSKVDVVKPHTPTVYRLLSATGAEDQYDASIDGPVEIVRPEYYEELYGPTNVDDPWYLAGWYKNNTIDMSTDYAHLEWGIDYLYISGDKFLHATGTLSIKPYRAIFEVENLYGGASSSKAMTISFTDDSETDAIEAIVSEDGNICDVEAIYNISGHKINSLQQGVNIVKMSNGETKKVVIK